MAIYMWRKAGPLCFTAEAANIAIYLNKNGSPTSVTLETSTDGSTWTSYTFGMGITLSNIGDKVYFRNTSETTTGFSTGNGNYYQFAWSGNIKVSGDITSLINKNCTDTITTNYCFYQLFKSCTNLTKPPLLPATTVTTYCYGQMFYGCTGLTDAPALPATTLNTYCYYGMFQGCTNLVQLPNLPAKSLKTSCYSTMFKNCSKIKLSSTQTGTYQTPYRIPTTGTGSTGTYWNSDMFYGTGGTFTSDPSINTTYYTSNTVI